MPGGMISLLAGWLGGGGGAGADDRGMRSLLAFWMGGVGVPSTAPPVVAMIRPADMVGGLYTQGDWSGGKR